MLGVRKGYPGRWTTAQQLSAKDRNATGRRLWTIVWCRTCEAAVVTWKLVVLSLAFQCPSRFQSNTANSATPGLVLFRQLLSYPHESGGPHHRSPERSATSSNYYPQCIMVLPFAL